MHFETITIHLLLDFYYHWRGILDTEEGINCKPFTTISSIISEKWNWMISTGNDILTGLVPDNLDCNMCGSVPLFQEFRTIGVLFGLKMITSLDDTTFPTAHWSLSHILHCAELSVPERNSPKRKPCIHLLTCNSLWDRTISLIPFVQDRFLITVNT